MRVAGSELRGTELFRPSNRTRRRYSSFEDEDEDDDEDDLCRNEVQNTFSVI
jgi:hypothetical protein